MGLNTFLLGILTHYNEFGQAYINR